MVHAFILGTNIFISAQRTVSYVRDGQRDEFLNILSFYHKPETGTVQPLAVDATFSMVNGEPVEVRNNQLVRGTGLHIETEPKRVRIYQTGHEVPVLDVFQLDENAYHGFGSHIANELSAREPDVAVTIKGDFVVAGASIWIGNETMHINDDAIASGVFNAHQGVILTSDGHSY